MDLTSICTSFITAIVVEVIFGILGKHFLDKEIKKYETELTKGIEKYRQSLSNKTYVSKEKFDICLEILREVTEKMAACFEAVKTITVKNGYGIENPMDDKKIAEVVNQFKNVVDRSILVIPPDLHHILINLLNTFHNQISAYKAIIKDEEDDDIESISFDELETKENEVYNLMRECFDNLEITTKEE